MYDWPSLDRLQAALDERCAEWHATRRCPITGTLIAEGFQAEHAQLLPLPTLHELFDCVVARPVSRDCLVSFEGRRSSVPFAWVGRAVEVRGTTQHVVVWVEGRELARHPRHTVERLVIDERHYLGASTDLVLAPTPLGQRARQQLGTVPHAERLPAPETISRPMTQYTALLAALTGGR